MTPKKPSHIDAAGRAKMVNLSGKKTTLRRARARAKVVMKPSTLEMIRGGKIPKGDAFETARLAGIIAAKQTPHLIPLCHPVAVRSIDIDIRPAARGVVEVIAQVSARDVTGVEMEALTAASVAALTIYDMCKAVEHGIEIREVVLLEKTGGKSGTYRRKGK